MVYLVKLVVLDDYNVHKRDLYLLQAIDKGFGDSYLIFQNNETL